MHRAAAAVAVSQPLAATVRWRPMAISWIHLQPMNRYSGAQAIRARNLYTSRLQTVRLERQWDQAPYHSRFWAL